MACPWWGCLFLFHFHNYKNKLNGGDLGVVLGLLVGCFVVLSLRGGVT